MGEKKRQTPACQMQARCTCSILSSLPAWLTKNVYIYIYGERDRDGSHTEPRPTGQVDLIDSDRVACLHFRCLVQCKIDSSLMTNAWTVHCLERPKFHFN